MGSIIGFIVIMVMVFGGYVSSGGNMGIILHALPHELPMIFGASIGAFVVANSGAVMKHTMHDLKMVLRGPRWKRDDYKSLLCLMYEIVRVAKNTPMQLEKHIDAPAESPIFQKYPEVTGDEVAMTLICDYLRSIGMNFDDPFQVEDIMQREIDKRLEDNLHGSHALQTMADGLPAIGIVAAVLGVIKTMGSIDQPPAILGKMIGGALVGTFLGVFLSYCFVAPLAHKIKTIHEQDQCFYTLIKDVLVAFLRKHQPNTCLEIARKNVPQGMRPTFAEVDETLRTLKGPAATK